MSEYSGNYINTYNSTFVGITNQYWSVLSFPSILEEETDPVYMGGDCLKYTMDWTIAPLQIERHWRMAGMAVNIPKDSGSTVTISWDTLLYDITFQYGTAIPRLKIELWAYNGIDASGNTMQEMMDVQTVDVSLGEIKHNIVNLKYKDNETTIYYVLVYFTQAYSSAAQLTAYFRNFRMFRNNDSDKTEQILFAGELENNAIDLYEDDVEFGTSDSSIDAGALLYGVSALTSTWSNYGGSENMKLQNLLIKNKLTQYSRFKNYLRITVKTDSIRFNQLIAIMGKLYQITAYSFDLMNNNLQLELIEYLNTPVAISYTEELLIGNEQ